MDTTNLKSFHYLENGEVSFSILDTVKCSNHLDPGFYDLTLLPYPKDIIYLKKSSNNEATRDHYYPDKEKIATIIDCFCNKTIKAKVNALGFNHKVGLLLHGREGTGKSSIVRYFSHKLFSEHQAIVFNLLYQRSSLSRLWEFIRSIRQIQDNLIVVIMEEFDNQIGDYESSIKTMMDGPESIDNCVFFATTNYIERIPDALKKRESRFKYCLNIESIQEQVEVRKILAGMIGDIYSPEEIDAFATQLTPCTVDCIKHFALDKIMNINTPRKTRNRIGFLQNN